MKGHNDNTKRWREVCVAQHVANHRVSSNRYYIYLLNNPFTATPVYILF